MPPFMHSSVEMSAQCIATVRKAFDRGGFSEKYMEAGGKGRGGVMRHMHHTTPSCAITTLEHLLPHF